MCSPPNQLLSQEGLLDPGHDHSDSPGAAQGMAW